ncbi:hypothetical protein ABW19_dt0200659 [Dactylella cylindrospora]|nr:hypothetical protein ABW19_dt0200659 [Dactylella cylindrospora]
MASKPQHLKNPMNFRHLQFSSSHTYMNSPSNKISLIQTDDSDVEHLDLRFPECGGKSGSYYRRVIGVRISIKGATFYWNGPNSSKHEVVVKVDNSTTKFFLRNEANGQFVEASHPDYPNKAASYAIRGYLKDDTFVKKGIFVLGESTNPSKIPKILKEIEALGGKVVLVGSGGNGNIDALRAVCSVGIDPRNVFDFWRKVSLATEARRKAEIKKQRIKGNEASAPVREQQPESLSQSVSPDSTKLIVVNDQKKGITTQQVDKVPVPAKAPIKALVPTPTPAPKEIAKNARNKREEEEDEKENKPPSQSNNSKENAKSIKSPPEIPLRNRKPKVSKATIYIPKPPGHRLPSPPKASNLKKMLSPIGSGEKAAENAPDAPAADGEKPDEPKTEPKAEQKEDQKSEQPANSPTGSPGSGNTKKKVTWAQDATTYTTRHVHPRYARNGIQVLERKEEIGTRVIPSVNNVTTIWDREQEYDEDVASEASTRRRQRSRSRSRSRERKGNQDPIKETASIAATTVPGTAAVPIAPCPPPSLATGADKLKPESKVLMAKPVVKEGKEYPVVVAIPNIDFTPRAKPIKKPTVLATSGAIPLTTELPKKLSPETKANAALPKLVTSTKSFAQVAMQAPVRRGGPATIYKPALTSKKP